MASETKAKQSYKYRVADSILGTEADEYRLSQEEYYRLHLFYVTHSLCKGQSLKGVDFVHYGWASNSVKNPDLEIALMSVLNLRRNSLFIFTDKDDLATRFSENSLEDGRVDDLSSERAVVGKTSAGNNYLKLFYRIRDCFAHGKFKLRISEQGEKMVVMQDDNTSSVTARIVLKLDTLLGFIDAIDRNRVLESC